MFFTTLCLITRFLPFLFQGQINLQQPNYQSEKMMKEKEEMIQNLRSEIESLRNAINPIKPGNNSEFSRLEEQFEIIKVYLLGIAASN